jgi:PAS domain S-box-containing protein
MPRSPEPAPTLDGLRSLLDRSPDILFRMRPGNPPRFEFVSAAALAITGHPAEAFVEDRWLYRRVFDSEARRDLWDVLDAPASELPDRLELPIHRADGTPGWVEVTLAKHVDATGEVVTVDGVVRDVTERVAAGRRAVFEAGILAAIADGVVVTDTTERITFWNPGAERLFGVGRAEALGGPLELMFPEGRSSGHEALRAALATTSAWEGDIRLERPDGSVGILEVVSYPFWQDDPPGSRVSLVWDVTDARAATDAVGRLAAIVEQADDAIYAVDRDGIVLSWNAGAERLTGIKAADAIGRIGPFAEEPARKAELRRRGFEGETINLRTTRLLTADGGTVPVDLSVSPVRDRDGNVVALSAVARDDRPRLAAERELRYRDAILASVNDGVIATDHDTRLIYWSPGAERLFGIPAAQAVGGTLEEIAPVRMPASSVESAMAVLAGGQDLRIDVEYVRPDGSTFVGETSASTMQGPDGTLVGLAVIRDVTAVRRSVHDSARLAALVEGAGDIMVGTDTDGVVRSWNPAAERVLGYRPDEVIGSPIATVVAPGPLPQADELRDRLTRDGAPSAAAELELVTRDGVALPAWAVIAPIRDAHGTIVGISWICHDLRERKALEDQLRQAQKLEAIGRLAGGIAHDFNNLLTAVSGYASLLLSEVEPGSTAATDVAHILDAADRAGDLTRSLLAFSRGRPREPRVVALDDVVTSVGPMLRRLLPEAVHLELDAHSGVSLLVDPTELELVLVNLAVNGADAMPHGGRLAIRARAVDLDAAFAVAHLGVRPGPHGELVVRDTGAGMTDEVRSRIFEPFFTTKHERGGTGLGLSAVHAYVERAGGTIWVDSEVGHGTTIRILVPVVEDVPEGSRAVRRRHAPGGSERIVLVEDDTAVRALATTVLKRAGYALTVMADPREALALDPATFDLLLTDVVMPHLDGVALAIRYKAARPDLPVLFMSGYPEGAEPADLAALSAQPVLAKPFGPAELLSAVRRTLVDRS